MSTAAPAQQTPTDHYAPEVLIEDIRADFGKILVDGAIAEISDEILIEAQEISQDLTALFVDNNVIIFTGNDEPGTAEPLRFLSAFAAKENLITPSDGAIKVCQIDIRRPGIPDDSKGVVITSAVEKDVSKCSVPASKAFQLALVKSLSVAAKLENPREKAFLFYLDMNIDPNLWPNTSFLDPTIFTGLNDLIAESQVINSVALNDRDSFLKGFFGSLPALTTLASKDSFVAFILTTTIIKANLELFGIANFEELYDYLKGKGIDFDGISGGGVTLTAIVETIAKAKKRLLKSEG